MTTTPTPTVTGTFQKTPFPHILIYLFQRKISGTLVVRHETLEELIWFEKGTPSAASFSFNPANMRAGLLALFSKPYAYEFYEDTYLIKGAAEFAETASSLSLIRESLRQGGREEVIAVVLNHIKGKVLTVRKDISLEAFELDEKELKFITALQKEPCTTDKAIERTDLPKEHARRLLYLLAIAKAFESLSSDRNKPSMSLPTMPKVVMPATPQPASEPVVKSVSSQPIFRAKSKRPEPKVSLAIPEPPNNLPAALKQRWIDITQRYQHIEDMNYFEALGIDLKSSPEDAAAAYMKLVKVWHPDRLPPALSALIEHSRVIFRYLTEAYETLTSENKRAEYLELVGSGAASPAEQRRLLALLDSVTEVQRASVLLQQRSFEEALFHAKNAVELAPQDADAHVILAWALYNIHGQSSAPPFEEMLRSLNLALDQNERHERAHYYKGMVLKRMGKIREALGHFKLSAQINPHNVEAAREIRLADMRKQSQLPSKTPVKGSLLDKLFKK